MKKFLSITMLFISFFSAQAAQEPELVEFSDAAIQEFFAISEDVIALKEGVLRKQKEVLERRMAESRKEVVDLLEQLIAEGRNNEERREAIAAFDQALAQEVKVLLQQEKIGARKRVKELFVLRAPTALAEDPELKKLFRLG